MLDAKLIDVLATDAEYCTALDNSCLMHLGGALHRQKKSLQTIHMASILASTENIRIGQPHEHARPADLACAFSVMDPRIAPPFPTAAFTILRTPNCVRTLLHATDVIQAKRNKLVAEKSDWQELRTSAAAIRAHVLANLDTYLEQFETACTAAGGTVHWARDAAEARAIILNILREENATEVIKIKTMTSAEIQLNPALEAAGIAAIETDLAEIILQLGDDEPSHIVVPALHVNRTPGARDLCATYGPAGSIGRS